MSRTRSARPSNAGVEALFLGLVLLLLSAFPIGAAAEPARSIPVKGLIAYVEYDGIEGNTEAWKATAAYAMFKRHSAGAMTREIVRQVATSSSGRCPTSRSRGPICSRSSRRPCAASSPWESMTRRDAGLIVIVLSGLGRGEARDRVGRLARRAATSSDDEGGKTVAFRRREMQGPGRRGRTAGRP